MSIYKTEKPEILTRCLKSIWDDQVIKPTQIVLVVDGPVHKNLMNVIYDFRDRLEAVVDVVELTENIGLGEALAVGLEYVRFDLVARMDTDDVSLPHRFQKQLEFMLKNDEVHVLGSHVEEFSVDPEQVTGTRRVPLDHKEIVKTATYKNPINHPSVMYRKSQVLDAGGPVRFVGFDDYFLWVRMIQNGAVFRNLDQVLVKLQAGPDLISRRSGIKYAKIEWNFQLILLRLGFIKWKRFILNISSRVLIRLLPKYTLEIMYKILRKS